MADTGEEGLAGIGEAEAFAAEEGFTGAAFTGAEATGRTGASRESGTALPRKITFSLPPALRCFPDTGKRGIF